MRRDRHSLGLCGAVEALDLARLYLERGDFDTALVIGRETISPLTVPVFLGRDPDRVRMRDRLGIYNFGDGAGAMVLRADEREGIGMLGSAICSIGGDRKPGMQVIGGGTHAPITSQLECQAADRAARSTSSRAAASPRTCSRGH